MSTPILATKLYIPPPRPKFVLRPHLVERLDEALHHKLTLISAPAGFGKTTLLSEWIAGYQRPVAWVSLDEGDNDTTRFLAYLVAALQTLDLPSRTGVPSILAARTGSKVEGISPKIGEGVLSMLQSPQPPPTEVVLTSLINELSAIHDNIFLVLDDYHVVESSRVNDVLAFVLENLPHQMHMVITTREDPDLPLARLRAKGQLIELRAKDLRFTPAEAAEFLNQVMGLNLSTEETAALGTRTEGWIAGLQLAALSMQGREDVESFIQAFTGSHHFVLDYLVEEVLQRLPEHVRSFLLQTSILSRLCGPLCDAVRFGIAEAQGSPKGTPVNGSEDGREMLRDLERSNLFVVPLDDQHQWFRYHHLFADVLQVRLMEEQPNQVPILHQRASEWYERNSLLADAIRHALAARDFEHAADLIELEWSEYSGTRFQSATWLGWVKALPDELVQIRPTLSLGFAWDLLFSGELETAEARLRDADRLLGLMADIRDHSEGPSTNGMVVNEEKSRSLRASLAIAWAFHAQALGDVLCTEKYARRALNLIPETDHYMRGLASAQLGLACWAYGDLEPASRYMATALVGLRMAGNHIFATSCAYVLADIRVAQGRLFDAATIYEDALRSVKALGEPVIPGTADMFLGLSELYREQGNVEAARQHLLRCEELGKQAALPEWPYDLYLAQARMKEDQGDLDGALELLNKAEGLYHRNPVPNVRPVAALKARVWIRQGRLAEALSWAHQRELTVDDDLSYLREFELVTLARVLIARYKSDRAERSIHEAIGLLERLLKAAEEGGRMGSVIEILVQQALAHLALGDILIALVPLERALILAESQGYVRVFVDEGIPMAELLTRMKDKKGGRKEYVHKLLAAYGKGKDTLPSSRSSQPLVEPLSQRELEVLQLIAQGLSNHEISERLFLALNTVKGHNRKIFEKLQVQRRTEAVARARELGLL